MSRWIPRFSIAVCLWLVSGAATAQTRAWLDRDRIAAGETATLNIETDQAAVASPDYAPLLGDFALSGHSSTRRFETINGAGRTTVLFAVALEPRREGVIGIPGMRVGTRRTQPLTLTVTPPAAAPARAGGVVFIEAEADAQEPYVQQAVGYVVRLYYSTPLISGQLDQDPPEGASLQRVGEDLQYSREIGRRRYTVVERRYLLIPERSGTVTIPGARFRGRGAGGFFDEIFGDGQRDLRAAGAPKFVAVRPPPANAPQPWLPLRGLTLRYLATPQGARAGEAASVTVEAIADGASATQMPELQLPVGSGAQVFADPAQSSESFAGGRPQVRVARKFSIVPSRAGTLRIPGPRMPWWDVRAGLARTASLPDIVLPVAPGPNGFGAQPAPASPPGAVDAGPDEGWVRVPWVQGAVRPWALGTVIFALLWLATLWWGLHRQPQTGSSAASRPAPPADAAPRDKSRQTLRRALEGGDLADVAEALCAMASPPAPDLDAVRRRLEDPAQVAAVDALQRARWGDGDGAAARAALREAFKRGPRWRATEGLEGAAQGRAGSKRTGKARAGKNQALLRPLYPDGPGPG